MDCAFEAAAAAPQLPPPPPLLPRRTAILTPCPHAMPPPAPQMMRVLGHVPRRFATSGRRSHEFFSALGQLWDAPRQPHWPLDKLLEERHGLPEEEVRERGRAAAAAHVQAAGQLHARAAACAWRLRDAHLQRARTPAHA